MAAVAGDAAQRECDMGEERSTERESPDPLESVESASSSGVGGEARRLEDIRDRRLVRRMRSGDERAFEELVRIYKNRIYSLMVRMIGNRQEAEDLAQEVFITVHRAIGTFRGEARFQTWLYRIATNACKNRIKYLKGRPVHGSVPVDEAPGDGPREPVTLQSSMAGPEAMAVGNRLQAAIARELGALEPEQRLLIVLRDVQGLSYAEMVKVTGLPLGTLKSRLHRARLTLKDRMKPYLG